MIFARFSRDFESAIGDLHYCGNRIRPSPFPSNIESNMRSEMRLSRVIILLSLAVVVIVFARRAASFLVVDKPEKSDAIVVLAGETEVRPARAVELLRQGAAPHVF